MTSSILSLVTSDELQKKIIKYGKKRSKEFSWEKCTKETIEVYKKLLR